MGRFKYLKNTSADILSWICSKWKPFNSNIIRVMTLVNGLVIFHFVSVEDKGLLVYWVIDKGLLVLAHWTFDFDRRKKLYGEVTPLGDSARVSSFL